MNTTTETKAGKRMGRPNKPAGQLKTFEVRVMLTESQLKRLQEKAETDDMSLSSYIRRKLQLGN